MTHHSHQTSLSRGLVMLAFMAVGLAAAWAWPGASSLQRLEGYMPLHTAMEVGAVVIACLVFVSGWHAHSRELPRAAVILGCAFLGVALLDFAHTMSFMGMPAFITPNNNPEKTINFWLSARLLAALAFLAVALQPFTPLAAPSARFGWLAVSLAFVLASSTLIFTSPSWLPHTYDAATGLTWVKIGTEYGIVSLNAATAVLLWRSMRQAQPFDVAALFCAVCAMALSECFFTFYTRINDTLNIAGHVYKVVSYFFLYRAVFVAVIESPYRQLAKLSDQLKATLDAVPDLMLEVDLAGRYHAIHSHHPEMLAMPAQDLLGKTLDEVMPPEAVSTVRQALDEAMASGHSSGRQLMLALAHGLRWFELSVSRKGNPAGKDTRFILLARDVTERMQAQEAQRAQEAASQASQAKSEFLSRMSHELRTPLNAVIGFAQLLLYTETAKLAPGQRLHATHILKAGRHLLDMVNDILDLTRIESGHAALEIEVVPLADAVAASLSMIAPQARDRDIRVVAEAVLLDRRQVMADARCLRQVLINVLSNAVKYNRVGGDIVLQIKALEGQGDQWTLVVTDTGAGLSQTQLNGLFEPFNRLGAEGKGIEGTGLGLLISRRIMASMGGDISVFSNVGVGTVVMLHLPRGPMLAAPSLDIGDGPRADEAPQASERPVVLCVEDNPLNVALLAGMFELRPQFQLVVGKDGASGLALMSQCQPCLMLIDFNLPDMTGHDLLKAVRLNAYGRHLICIATSADASGHPRGRALAGGFTDFWPKPMGVEDFLARLDAVMAEIDLRRRLRDPATAG